MRDDLNAVGEVVVGLPVSDRPTSSRFYRTFLDRPPVGEPQDDGEPEPLQFVVNDGLRLMLIPRGGFGWVVGDAQVTSAGTVEVLLSRDAADDTAVHRLTDAAVAGGGRVVVAPQAQPWGYAAVVADPDGHLWQVIANASLG
jgi:hypothetical protein